MKSGFKEKKGRRKKLKKMIEMERKRNKYESGREKGKKNKERI